MPTSSCTQGREGTQAPCRSAEYDAVNNECRISTLIGDETENESNDVAYMERICIKDEGSGFITASLTHFFATCVCVLLYRNLCSVLSMQTHRNLQ